MIAPALPLDEMERLESLRSLGLLDTDPEERFDAVTRLATMIFETPIAYISLVDETRQYLKSRVGLDLCESSRETSFCGHAILESQALIVPDTLGDERFADNPMVSGEPFARFYAGLPLRGPGGFNVGTLCLMDIEPRVLSEGEIARLNQLKTIAERELQLGSVIRMQDDLLKTRNALIESQRTIAQQMDEALAYVVSLLPQNISGKVRTSYEFIPSSTLGGDSFGFHWIDAEHFAIYLLDVCGHGVGSALLSVSAMNVLRGQTLPGVDFLEPSQVLAGMNRTFTMDGHNGLYFTMWYGVLDVATGLLRFAGAGHPPAVIVEPEGTIHRLGAPGLPIGCFDTTAYATGEAQLPRGSCLYVFSDGIYEVRDPSDSMGTYEEFVAILADAPLAETVIARIREQKRADAFEDDVSLIRVGF
ncbi:MAG: SpoIIE family protein phosphatase [Terrimicrobiaceae bacterium]|nr:SpoIIE family protein phosphatase [Terrimicrobiaceae bacterium]